MSRITVSALALLALLGFGCGDDDGGSGTSGTSGTGGTGGAGSGGTGGEDPGICMGDADDHPNCINEECADVSPTSGPRAMKGACCFRASNADRAQAAWNDTSKPAAERLATLEFRQNALKTTSQMNTVGNIVIQGSLANTYELDWSNTLVRVEGIPATGSGPVTVTIGAGRSNCDGTYSFFSETSAPDFGAGAAPLVERTDAARWAPAVMNGQWDWDTAEKLTIAAAERAPGVRWAPVAKDHGLLGYEQPSQDLDYKFTFAGTSSTDIEPNDLNCVGGELTGGAWTSSLVQTVFFPVAELETAMVDSAAVTQNFCSFMGVGYNASALCSEVPRAAADGCVRDPDNGEYCNWIELPGGMCDAEHCYIGDAEHPDANCGGTTGNDCCDPTGVTSPACNAFVIEATAVLAAAEITDEPHNDATEVFPNCTL